MILKIYYLDISIFEILKNHWNKGQFPIQNETIILLELHPGSKLKERRQTTWGGQSSSPAFQEIHNRAWARAWQQ
jgi:hypothetical protein